MLEPGFVYVSCSACISSHTEPNWKSLPPPSLPSHFVSWNILLLKHLWRGANTLLPWTEKCNGFPAQHQKPTFVLTAMESWFNESLVTWLKRWLWHLSQVLSFPLCRAVTLLFSRHLNEKRCLSSEGKSMLCANLAKENVVSMLNVHILYISVNNSQLLRYNFVEVENVHPRRSNFSSQEGKAIKMAIK